MALISSDLKEKVLGQIKPTESEAKVLEGIVDDFLNKVKKSSKDLGYDCEFFVGGSFGKGTYLKSVSDVDVFCRFSLKYEDSLISGYLKEILEGCDFEFKVLKGSRDYYEIEFGNGDISMIFETIPNFKLENLSDAKNTTDLSPFHVEFLKSKIAENSLIPDEIRICKQFFKAQGLYGAESYINGFSGHSIDILIAFYGSLENFLLDARNWEGKKVIDINSIYSCEKDLNKVLGKSKLSSLVLIDPIIDDRNAARALNSELYNKFLYFVNSVEELCEKDFEVSKYDCEFEMKKAQSFAKENNLDLFYYKVSSKLAEESEDIAGAKILKLFHKFESYFKGFDFKIFKSEVFIDVKGNHENLFVFYFEKVELSKLKKIKGPKVFMQDAIKAFKERRPEVFVEGDSIYAYDIRDVLRVEQVYKISVEDCCNMMSRDISFIKKVECFKF